MKLSEKQGGEQSGPVHTGAKQTTYAQPFAPWVKLFTAVSVGLIACVPSVERIKETNISVEKDERLNI